MKKSALVTGAAGFIGSVLCKKLKEHGGYYVDAWDLNEIDHKYFDVKRKGSYGDYFSTHYDVIFHLGANSLLGPSVNNPLAYYHNNVGEMLKMLKNLAHWKGAFIFASSAATYGDLHTSQPLTEDLAGKAINPYGSTKVVGEMMLRESCIAYGMKAYSMRFFNVAGSYFDLGQKLNQPHILTKMSTASVKNETFYINGKGYTTYDGTCVRDYIHVADVCDALILAAEKLYKMPSGEYNAYNVCSGEGVSNLELYELFSSFYSLKMEYKDVRPGDPGYLIGDSSKIKEHLNFIPKYSIEKIIQTHYEYTRKNI
jgi:UDP-glucose 4-epimerase